MAEPIGLVDAHCHVWTDDTSHYPLATSWKIEDMKPQRFTPEDLLKHAKAAGVSRINLVQMSCYYPRDLSSKIVHGFDNRYMVDMIALYPDIFVGTAVIDPHAEAPDKRMAELAKQGVRAFRIHPRLSKQPAERWLQPEGYAAMFAAGAKLNLAMSCLIDPDGLPELERMAKRYPDKPIIIDHLCRIGADGTIRAQDVTALCALAKQPRVYVKVGAFYALGKKQPPYADLAPLIQSVVKAFGARRCMWESDCPFQVAAHSYADSIDLVRKRLDFLSDDERDWLLRRTAAEFFFPK
jgi:predicted TIM-barrel fold metal-dependent hydrolase